MRAAGALIAIAACAGAPADRHPPALKPKLAPRPYTVARPDPAPPVLRLPTTVAPLAYRAQLSLEPAALAGTLEIDVRVDAETDVIWLHGEQLVVERATATSAVGVGTLLEARVVRGTGEQFLALLSPVPLAAGAYTLRLGYRAPVVDRGSVDAAIGDWYERSPRSDGVFRQTAEGRAYTYTMFEPMEARRAFPCFDEPRFKVPWQLTLEVPPGNIALSNTPVVAERVHAGRPVFEFAPTLPLPSYLIAFAVGPFELVDAGTSARGVPVRIAMRAGHGRDAAWAVRSTGHVLDLVERELGLPLPYPKLDVVAVPVTGEGWGAMENPGLVTVGESIVRADGTGGSTRRGYLETIAHEIAHQWFGDYVTPAWWDDIWLNESFASWLGPKVARDVATAWAAELAVPRPDPPPVPKGWRPRVLRKIAYARPPLAETRDLAQLAPYFGGERGLPAIEMLEALLGPAGLRRALASYLSAHAHGTATTADLARVLGAAAQLPLETALETSLGPALRPRVAVTAACTRGAGTITITQQGATEPHVPICVAYGDRRSRIDTCVVPTSPRAELALARCPTWLHPNPRRLPYTSPIAEPAALIEQGFSHLTAAERAALPESLDEPERLAVVLRLLEDPETPAVTESAHQLLATLPLLPDSLRAPFGARLREVLARRGARPRLADSLPPTAATPPETTPLLVAWMLAGDREARREAREAFPRWAELSTVDVGDAMLVAALGADPVLAGRALDQILAGAPAHRLTRALAATPYIRTLLEARGDAPAQLPDAVLYELVAGHCEPRERADAERLAKRLRPNEVGSLLLSFDACVKRRAALEPVFRAWLAAKPLR